MEVPIVLFEDNHCLAVSKPAGLLTQGVPPELPTLEAWAKDHLRTKYQKTGNVYLGVPHRLDRPVSGVVLFARNSKAAARLAEQFRVSRIEKVYWALVSGTVAMPATPWIDFIAKRPDEARVDCVEPEHPGAKEAMAEVHVLGRVSYAASTGDHSDTASWLEFRPRTGRTHQLRVQAARRGHPILGDELYGSSVRFGPPATLARDRVIALHARSLTFLHPIRYEPIVVEAPLPPYWPALE